MIFTRPERFRCDSDFLISLQTSRLDWLPVVSPRFKPNFHFPWNTSSKQNGRREQGESGFIAKQNEDIVINAMDPRPQFARAGVRTQYVSYSSSSILVLHR